MEMDRRTALALLSIGIASTKLEAAHRHLHALESKPQEYKLQFFTGSENAVVDRVTEMVVPADEHSPGAHQARVSQYIDLVAANSPGPTQQAWKERLAAFEKLAVEKHGKPFLQLPEPEQAALLDFLAATEKNPGTPAEHFFVDMKKATLFGYYTSRIGLLQELGYQGNQVLDEFRGCPHEPGKHQENF